MVAEKLESSTNTQQLTILLVVTLIILGACIFVAGYLWGINKARASSQSSSEQLADCIENEKGQSRHKQLLNQGDGDKLDGEMNIQMTMNANNSHCRTVDRSCYGEIEGYEQ